jgi:hypothetical protein
MSGGTLIEGVTFTGCERIESAPWWFRWQLIQTPPTSLRREGVLSEKGRRTWHSMQGTFRGPLCATSVPPGVDVASRAANMTKPEAIIR